MIRVATGIGMALAIAATGLSADQDPEAEIDELAIERFQAGEWENDEGYSQATRVGRLVYVSSTAAQGPTMEAQMRTIYRRIQATLGQYGATMDDVLRERVATVDIEAFKLANVAARMPHYKPGAYPARSWAQVERLADPGSLVEIEVVAVVRRD